MSLETMLQPPARERVVEDCCKLIDDEVKGKSGLTGVAVKMGYGVVKTFKPGFVAEVVNGLLDEWVEKLAPFHGEWEQHGGGKPFADWLRPRGGEVAERLLEVTDDKAKHAKSATVKKAYEKLRPSARKHVEEAVPGLARLVEKHAKG